MKAQYLLDTVSRMIRDKIITPESDVIVKAAGTFGEGVQISIEKHCLTVSAEQIGEQSPRLKIIGHEFLSL